MTRPLVNLAEHGLLRQSLEARPPRVLHAAFWLLLFSLALALGTAWCVRVDRVVVARGRVRARTPAATLRAPLAGRVARVLVASGERVARGQPVAHLDTKRVCEEQADVARRLATCRRELTELSALRAARSEGHILACQTLRAEAELAERARAHEARRRADRIRLAELAAEAACAAERRARELHTRGVGSAAQLEQACAIRERAEAELSVARRPLPPRDEDAPARHLAELEREHAASLHELGLEEARRRGDLARLEDRAALLAAEEERHLLRAPREGVVTALEAAPGDALVLGAAVARIAQPEEGLRLDLNLASTQVGFLRPGLPVRVKLDAYDYQAFGTLAGTLRWIAPDSSPHGNGPPLYRAEILLPSAQLGAAGAEARLGMLATAEVVVGRERVLRLALHSLLSKLDWTVAP